MSDETLLTEIRERFDYCVLQWQEIRDEGAKDKRYAAGDPWDPEERAARTKAKRPCLALDELNQYINQLNNDVRQNKRSIKINPEGEGANDQTALFRENLIRAIEYKSKAQTAYTSAFESAAVCGYGYFMIGTRFIEGSWNQEIYIRRIPDADTVWIDPDYKEADASDMEYAFVVTKILRKDYKRKYKHAEIRDFTSEHETAAPNWIQSEQIQVAEYWKVEKTYRTLMLLDDQGTTAYLDEMEGAKLKDKTLVMPEGGTIEILRSRKCEERSVCQYITNGVEILEKNEFPSKWIGLIPVFGKEVFLDDGSGSKRVLMSLIRLARDPFMLYCYYRTCQAELVGMTPKAKWVIAEGQIEGHEDEWQNSGMSPIEALVYKPTTDASGGQMLPPPQRVAFEPPIQALEMGAEGARRAIQSAMGINALPTPAQQRNEKSGVALQKISQQESIGSFHFIDNFDTALQHAGRIIDDLIPKIYDTEREVGVAEADGTKKTVKINTPEPQQDEKGGQYHYKTDEGDHGVTISTGPSFQSQRDAADDFVGTIIQNIEQLPLPPAVKAQFMALLIQLKNLGPIGDQMVKLLKGEDDPQQLQGKMARLQQQAQQQQEGIQQLQSELHKLQMEKQGKVIEMEAKLKIHAMDMELEKWKLDNARAIAEIQTQQQSEAERRAEIRQVWEELHGSAHEAATQAADQAHEHNVIDKQHANTMEQGDQAAQNQAALAQQAQEAQPEAGAQ